MHFINENVSTYEGFTAQLDITFYLVISTTFIIFALIFAYIIILLSPYAAKVDSTPRKFTLWLKIMTISTLLSAVVTAGATSTLVYADYYKGHYEASGTIDAVTFNKTYAGQAGDDGVYSIDLILDNGDPVTIQMPLDDADDVVPGAEFTLKSHTLIDTAPYDDFYPIEDITYYDSHQSLANMSLATGDTIIVDFIVDGKTVK